MQPADHECAQVLHALISLQLPVAAWESLTSSDMEGCHAAVTHSGLLHGVKLLEKLTHAVICLQDAVCRCLIDIAAGMDYLHSLGVLHGEQAC